MICYKSDAKKITVSIVNYTLYQDRSDTENITKTTLKHINKNGNVIKTNSITNRYSMLKIKGVEKLDTLYNGGVTKWDSLIF